MKLAAREWVGKAEADFLSAYREYRARHRPNFDATCFFTQQCIEKYLKARLVEAGSLLRERTICRPCSTPSCRWNRSGRPFARNATR